MPDSDEFKTDLKDDATNRNKLLVLWCWRRLQIRLAIAIYSLIG
jgi:hypothetical protein